jgi:hypothetical protein
MQGRYYTDSHSQHRRQTLASLPAHDQEIKFHCTPVELAMSAKVQIQLQQSPIGINRNMSLATDDLFGASQPRSCAPNALTD